MECLNSLLLINGTISGKVTDKDGNPISGASVTTSTCPGATCSTCATVITDANGNYKMVGLSTGYYVVKASKSGYDSQNPFGIGFSLGTGNCNPTTIQKTANFILLKTIKVCILSGSDWTDASASKIPCENYCKNLGHSGGNVTVSGSKSICAGASCVYISNFLTCQQSTVSNNGHCGCNSQFDCTCN